MYKKDRKVDTEDRITRPVCTKYEKSALIGRRARQLGEMAPHTLSNIIVSRKIDISNLNCYQIAEYEFKFGTIPLKIRRKMPNGSYEEFKIEELKRDHLY